ncbi:serine aminopeptidase domain-containing protein [Anditalea andensis]|uniref:Serine aminopeptidase S33 domain-containing protein n=1 Tax=Anditalea andensis TaxID=1048983 RepID=A0A074KTH3_9BACT|nr:alpha/beta hydrolase [Anditalea andensis]KEO73261.1 hypothetical protein EL17_12995 [Anditalea andensis]
MVIPETGKDGRNTHYKLVDSLLQNNIAVYRYDERGVGKSGGNYINLYIFSEIRKYNDLYFCISNLRRNDVLIGKQIGVIGHSEGGLASIEAFIQGAELDFMIQWAKPVKPFEMVKYQYVSDPNLPFFETLKMEHKKKGEFIDLVNEVVQSNKNLKNQEIKKIIDQQAKLLNIKRKDYKSYISYTLFISLLKKDYEATYKNINIPVLYIIGALDELVDPISNTELLSKMGNKKIDVQVVDGLYHMLTPKKFSEHKPDIYNIDDNALSKILEWVLNI